MTRNFQHAFKSLLLLAFLISSTSSQAQFNYGIRGGVYTGLMRPGNSDIRMTPTFGVFASYQEKKRISFFADVSYTDKGFHLDLDNPDPEYSLKYISIPIMFQYRISNRLSVFAGEELNWLISAHRYFDGSSENIKERVNSSELGWGGGINYKISPHFSLQVKAIRGFSNIFKSNYYYSYSDEEDDLSGLKQNQAVHITLSYALRKDTVHFSREEIRTKIFAGIRQGVSVSTLEGNHEIEVENSIGYEAGIDFRFEAGKYFYFSPGIHFQHRGGDVSIGTVNFAPVRLSYLTFPFAFGFSPVKTKPITLSAEAGLSLNYQLTAENVFADIESSGTYAIENKTIVSKFYGFEVATDAISGINLFFNFRNIEDNSSFVQRITNSYPAPDGVLSDLRLVNKSQVFTVGLRVKMKRGEERKHYYPKDSVAVREFISPFTIGVKGGANFNNTTMQEMPDGYDDFSKTSVGFHAGVYFQIRLFRNFSVIPELQYIRKGFKYSQQGTTQHVNMPYVELPLILSYAVSKKISIEAGPVFSVKTFSGEEADLGDVTVGYDDMGEYGITGGLRYKLFPKLSLACRYYSGLEDTSVFYWDDYHTEDTREVKKNIQLTAFWQLSP